MLVLAEPFIYQLYSGVYSCEYKDVNNEFIIVNHRALSI